MKFYGLGTAGPPPPFDWTSDWILATGQKPSVVLDFVNGLYYDGTSNTATLSSMVENATVDAGGLVGDGIHINCIGALLTALQNTEVTVWGEIKDATDGVVGGILSFGSGGPDTPVIQNDGDGSINTYDGVSLFSNLKSALFGELNRFATSWNASSRANVLTDYGDVASDATTYTQPVTSAVLCSYNGTFVFSGRIRRLAVYPVKVSSAYLNGMTWGGQWVLPFSGTQGLSILGSGLGSTNNVQTPAGALQYNFTQPWSVLTSTTMLGIGAFGNVIFTNAAKLDGTAAMVGVRVPSPSDGKLHSRILSGWDGASSSDIIEVHGSTVFSTSGYFNTIGATYDGSGTAAGIKFWVNGVAEAMTTVTDSIGASSVSGGNFWVGNQVGGSVGVNGRIGPFILYDVAKSPSFMVAATGSSIVMPTAADAALYYDFREGSGTFTADRSANQFNGTLSSSGLWVP